MIAVASSVARASIDDNRPFVRVPISNPAPDPFHAPAPTPDDLKVRAAVDRGLAFIVSLQQPDGCWRNDAGQKIGEGYVRNELDVPHIGVTALCCMALVAGGNAPDQGRYASNVRLGLDFLIQNQDRSGQIKVLGSRMYDHAFATLFLAEIFGMTRDSRIKKALQEATAFIVRNQVGVTIKPDGGGPEDGNQADPERDKARTGDNWGGWRYEPKQLDADMSITVCQLQALRAARNVGIAVPKVSIEAAREYVVGNYNDDDGSFAYQPQFRYNRVSFALSAAGIVALQSAGRYDSYRDGDRLIDLRKALNYLHQQRPDQASNFQPRNCAFGFWYGHYYAAQAVHQYKEVNPKMWQVWNDKNRRHFLAMQRGNGSWIDEIGTWDEKRNAYATAMACLILSIQNNYLPIFQA
ncbi:MAG: hypothetical protein HUU29_01985 [Planctomycetaceae bacterium]|nr:hypothetical protein [Planctomycetaceae bacterium]